MHVNVYIYKWRISAKVCDVVVVYFNPVFFTTHNMCIYIVLSHWLGTPIFMNIGKTKIFGKANFLILWLLSKNKNNLDVQHILSLTLREQWKPTNACNLISTMYYDNGIYLLFVSIYNGIIQVHYI